MKCRRRCREMHRMRCRKKSRRRFRRCRLLLCRGAGGGVGGVRGEGVGVGEGGCVGGGEGGVGRCARGVGGVVGEGGAALTAHGSYLVAHGVSDQLVLCVVHHEDLVHAQLLGLGRTLSPVVLTTVIMGTALEADGLPPLEGLGLHLPTGQVDGVLPVGGGGDVWRRRKEEEEEEEEEKYYLEKHQGFC